MTDTFMQCLTSYITNMCQGAKATQRPVQLDKIMMKSQRGKALLFLFKTQLVLGRETSNEGHGLFPHLYGLPLLHDPLGTAEAMVFNALLNRPP